jgi:uncharacterized protein YybS (DUF2232 family)
VKQRPASAMAESSLMAAIGAILVLVGYYVPIIGFFAMLLAPVPSAIAVIRHNLKWGVLCSLTTALILLLLIPPITVFGLWTAFGLMGVSLGYGVRKNYSSSSLVAFAALFGCIGAAVGFFLGLWILEISLDQWLDQTMNSFLFVLENAPQIMPEEHMFRELIADPELFKSSLLMAIPSSLILAGVIEAYLDFEVLRRVLKRFEYQVQPLPPFSRWIFPEYLAFAGIAGYLLVLSSPYHNIQMLHTAGIYILSITTPFFWVEIISLIFFYLWPRFKLGCILVAYVAVTLIFTPWASFLAILGLTDILFDYRRIRGGWRLRSP